MKNFWSNSKEKLVAVEEGKVDLEIPKNGTCKKFMQLVQFILVIEIALFLGWASYSFYQSKYVSPMDAKEDYLRINPVNALKNNFKLNPESLNDSDVIAWQEKSSQDKALDPPSISEPWPAKTQSVEIPESSTERNSVLLNKDSVNHPQSSSPDVTTPVEIETSSFPYVKETTDIFEKNLVDFLNAKAEIAKKENSKNLVTESFLKSEVTPGKLEEASEIPQISILVSESDDDFSEIQEFQKELEQELEKDLGDLNGKEEFSLPSLIKVLHDLDREESKLEETIPTTEIAPSSEGQSKKYHFQFSMGRETGIEESDDLSDSPVFLHIFFNVSDGDVSSSEDADSVLKSEESVLDSISPFIDPEFDEQSKIEDSPLDDETWQWWVNTPNFQKPRDEGLNKFDEVSAEESLFDLFFIQPESQNVTPKSAEDKEEVSEILESPPEDLDNLFTEMVSKVLLDEDQSDEDTNEKMNSLESNYSTVKILKDILPEEITPEETSINKEKVQKELEDFMKVLEKAKMSDEDHEIIGSMTESLLRQEESMTVKEETVSEEGPETPKRDIDWENLENWFQSQPTWQDSQYSDGYSNIFDNFEAKIDEYDEPSNFDSEEYNYEN